jgi:ribonuclease D
MRNTLTNNLYKNDIPKNLDLGETIAVDCETMGLNINRDRLCLVQLSGGDGNAHLVQIEIGQSSAPNLCKVLSDPNKLKLFHFGRFDIAILLKTFGVLTSPVYCTKIASKLVRTYTDRHGLKNLLEELLKIDISKQQQSSYWGTTELSSFQKDYAASDVLHLHKLKGILDDMLKRESREDLSKECFNFLPFRAKLDLEGWPDIDLFSH